MPQSVKASVINAFTYVTLYCSVGELMSIKKHQLFCKSFGEKFPQHFNFESCALLFIDPADHSLYKVTDAEEQDDLMSHGTRKNYKTVVVDVKQEKKPTIIRLTVDKGITSQAIQHRKIMSVARAQECMEFAPEVDNTVRAPVVENCLIGPCIDSEGKMRGVV